MRRLIDADALLYHLADYQLQESPGWGANGCGNADAYEAITNCMKAIEDAPTIEPERKAGRWIIEPGYIPKCSECGIYSDDADNGNDKFCPNCGSAMTEEGEQ